MKIKMFVFLVAFVLGFMSGSARIYSYHGLNFGVAWNRGGIEILPAPAIFLCAGDYNPITQEFKDYHVPKFLEFLLTDC